MSGQELNECKAVKAKDSIGQTIVYLKERLEVLHGEIGNLTAKLDPILIPEPPSEVKSGGPMVQEAESLVLTALNNIASQINDGITRIQRLETSAQI